MNTETLNQGLARWLLLHSIDRKPRSIDFNKEVATCVRDNWKECLDRQVDEIGPAEAAEFAQRVSRYSPSRYNACISAIQSCVPAAKGLPRKAPQRTDHSRIPTPEQLVKLLTALDGAPNSHAGLVVRFLVLSGMRINESRRLRWSDVKSDHFMVPSAITKNGLARSVPFVPGMREVLDALKRVADGSDLVLPHKQCYRSLRYACDMLGFPRFNHHAMRHCFATTAVQSGVDMPTVAKILGHQDGGALLAKTYCHVLNEHVSAMAQKIRFDLQPVP